MADAEGAPMSADGTRYPGRVAPVWGARVAGLTVSRLHRSGVTPARLLVLGGRMLLASPRYPPAEVLAERLADRVWLKTRRGVDLDMVWELRPALALMSRGVEAWRLWRYDAVVVVAPARPLSLLLRWSERGAPRRLHRLVDRISESTRLVVVEIESPTAHHHTVAPAREGRWAASTRSKLGTSALSGSPDSAVAAELIAEFLVASALNPGVARRDVRARHLRSSEDEALRQEAVDEAARRIRRAKERLQLIVDLALEAFETTSAEITFLDRDQQRTVVSAGAEHGPLPRATSLCNRSIQADSVTVIEDTWQMPDLAGNPNVTGTQGIRFYAAYPIESIDGHRIGVLCVWDLLPRGAEEFDMTALRDLALLAEAEIITADPQ